MSYFVRIENATEVRRGILETTKDFLSILSAYHHILDLRDKKLAVAKGIEGVLAELDELFTKAAAALPERSTKEVARYLPEEEPRPAPQSKPVKASELDRLQEKLSLIEDRLNKL